MSFPTHITVDQLFAAQATQAPDAVALIQTSPDSASVSYVELDRWSDWIAHELAAMGIGPGCRVALLMGRSAELIAGMLGVLKAGAAFVPLDPASPLERLRWLVADCESGACLTSGDSRLRELAARLGPRVLSAGDVPDPRERPLANPPRSSDSDSPAYVMYTSGSTGQPKGVVIPHRAIVRLVRDQTYAQLDAGRVLLHLAPAAFDASTFEIWGALLNGGRCVLAPDDGVPDLPRLRQVIASHGVTTLWLTASLFNTIIDHAPETLATVGEVLTGGEALSLAHVRRAQDLLPGVQLINGYGPTESTTFACCFRIPRPIPSEWRSIPIGTPIGRTTAFVLDDHGREVAQGEVGELCIGGEGLAMEYLRHPELTAAKFVESERLGRLYRTGDRARLLPDGSLEFLGRDDDQVKLRGYRIEPGEVENALRAIAGVSDAVVTLREDIPGDRRLVAYFTATDCIAGPTPGALRDQLAARLPDYMVPSAFVQLDAIPLTANGKADRGALPAPSRSRPALDRPASAPATRLEEWLVAHWREVLQLDDVGVHDRFFELGGTSLAAMRFLSRMNAETRAVLPALLLFRAPTIAELAGVMEREYRDALPLMLLDRPVAAATETSLRERIGKRESELEARRMRRRRAT